MEGEAVKEAPDNLDSLAETEEESALFLRVTPFSSDFSERPRLEVPTDFVGSGLPGGAAPEDDLDFVFTGNGELSLFGSSDALEEVAKLCLRDAGP